MREVRRKPGKVQQLFSRRTGADAVSAPRREQRGRGVRHRISQHPEFPADFGQEWQPGMPGAEKWYMDVPITEPRTQYGAEDANSP